MKKIFTLILAASALIYVSCKSDKADKAMPSAGEEISVKLEAISKSDIGEVVSASGQFTTDDETVLSFKTGGLIRKIYVKEGESVQKGQLLASLDLTEISAMVNQAQLGVEKASRDYQRAENLYKDSVATLEQFQNAKTGLDLAKQQYAAAQFNQSYSEIRAMSDGVILRKLANAGQIVGPGTPVLQTNSKGESDWLLKVGVSDKQWSKIAVGDSATISSDAVGDKLLSGKISSKSENADQMTGSFMVEIKISNAKKSNLASGMFGKAEIYLSKPESLWRIPYESLLDGNGDKGFVFVTNDKKTVSKVPVVINRIEHDYVMLSSGLESWDYLVVAGSAYLSDKSTIKIEAE
ncbi:MAG: efflux RND transporter periplasmic adaptor subunit [Bacteroidetes bacterium]|nr:efflux RND transporter periplasmic adaptor subunit [Bacteroidota bacterium]